MSARSRRVIVFLLFVAVLVPLVPLVLWSLTQVWPYDQVLPELSLRAWRTALC